MNDEAVPRQDYAQNHSDSGLSEPGPLLSGPPEQPPLMKRGYLIAAAVVIVIAIGLMIAMRSSRA